MDSERLFRALGGDFAMGTLCVSLRDSDQLLERIYTRTPLDRLRERKAWGLYNLAQHREAPVDHRDRLDGEPSIPDAF